MYVQLPWLAELVKAPSLLYGNLCWFEPTLASQLVADLRDQQHFEPGEWGLIVWAFTHNFTKYGCTTFLYRCLPIKMSSQLSGIIEVVS